MLFWEKNSCDFVVYFYIQTPLDSVSYDGFKHHSVSNTNLMKQKE